MGRETNIAWADHTWNPWRGCAKVSEGCDLCYAAAMSVRNPKVLGTWGEDGSRPFGNRTYMRQPYRWSREAGDEGERRRVFCGSLMDFWEDRPDLREIRCNVLETADDCDHLDWLFLTKRPQKILPIMRRDCPSYLVGLKNVVRQSYCNWWMGCTVENMARARERIDVLLSVPASVRFLSCEPLLEPLDLVPWLKTGDIHWVIVGGESSQGGEKARHLHVEWIEEIVNDCLAHKVPVFVKQMGSRPLANGLGLRLKDRHGGDEEEWPPWLRVRQVPRCKAG